MTANNVNQTNPAIAFKVPWETQGLINLKNTVDQDMNAVIGDSANNPADLAKANQKMDTDMGTMENAAGLLQQLYTDFNPPSSSGPGPIQPGGGGGFQPLGNLPSSLTSNFASILGGGNESTPSFGLSGTNDLAQLESGLNLTRPNGSLALLPNANSEPPKTPNSDAQNPLAVENQNSAFGQMTVPLSSVQSFTTSAGEVPANNAVGPGASPLDLNQVTSVTLTDGTTVNENNGVSPIVDIFLHNPVLGGQGMEVPDFNDPALYVGPGTHGPGGPTLPTSLGQDPNTTYSVTLAVLPSGNNS